MIGKRRILIVDDNAGNRLLLQYNLEGYFEIDFAGNGLSALDKFTQNRYDLILMDIHMPDMDGIAAVKAIKSFDTTARIIMCSAMGQQAMVIDAIQAGAKDFIVKPFQPERVIEAVSKALE